MKIFTFNALGRAVVAAVWVALVCAGGAAAQNADAVPAAYGRGWAALDAKDYDTALKEFNEVIRLGPNSALGYMGRGSAYIYKEAYDRAIADLTVAIRLAEPVGNREVMEALYEERAKAYIEKTCWDKAVADLENAKRLASNSTALDNKLTILKIAMKRNDWDRKCVVPTSATASPSPQPAAGVSGLLTDSRDGKKYKTVVIGGKRWFAENLNYQTPGGSWCYDNNSSNCNKYGRLYDWNTAMKACPAEYHLPSNEEWNGLVKAAGGSWSGFGNKLKSKIGWKSSKGIVNEDAYGFSAMPGGYRNIGNGNFFKVGNEGNWWTNEEYRSSYAMIRDLFYDEDFFGGHSSEKGHGFSVRCVND